MSLLPNINIQDFDYKLDKEKIANYPAQKRELSKLLYFNKQNNAIEHKHFPEIVDLIPQKSLIIRNSTKVIAARLLMKKQSSGKCELLLTEPIYPHIDPAIVMSSKNKCAWECMIGGKNIKIDSILDTFFENLYNFKAKVNDRYSNYGVIEFTWDGDITFSEIISHLGKIPLPPYIDRDTEKLDYERYQTIYANKEGSIAAPTAGLHFTNEIFAQLSNNNIEISDIILHVGPGTFLPVSSDNISEHNMHEELIIIHKATLQLIKEKLEKKQDIIAVGTTSVRTIESLYWLGMQIYKNKNINLLDFYISQDFPYQFAHSNILISPTEAINSILLIMNTYNMEFIIGKTQLFIVPSYKYKIINGIITNFHLPKSTLLLLVSAFLGEEKWKEIYESALENDYRFLSYGDSSFLFDRI